MNRIPTKHPGLSRIWAAFFYSLHGLRYVLANAAALRQEAALVAVLTVVLLFLPLTPEWKGLLFLATTLVLVVELLNSAIEVIVDLASPEYHVLAKHAKDLGSGAVLVSLFISGLLWCCAPFMIISV